MHLPAEHVNTHTHTHTHIYQVECINYQRMLAHQHRRLIKAANEEIEASSPEGLINQLDKVAQQPGRVHQPA